MPMFIPKVIFWTLTGRGSAKTFVHEVLEYSLLVFVWNLSSFGDFFIYLLHSSGELAQLGESSDDSKSEVSVAKSPLRIVASIYKPCSVKA